jgi:cellulase/cellobiase CelA1
LSGAAPNVIYTPNENYSGSDSFSFKANDGAANSNIATISITINAVNDAPVAANQNLVTSEDSSLNITLSASDIDSGSLTFSVVSGPSHGSLSGTAPNFTYTPNANYNGNDSFTFKASDGQDDSNTATISIEVIPVNDAPVASTQNVTLSEDAAKAITLGATDADGDALTYVIVTAPLKGALTGSGANWTYTPNTNVNGPDSFAFKASDGQADSNTATVNLNIQPVNDAPVANTQNVTTAFNTAKSIVLTGSDIDDDALNFIVVSGPSKGTLSGSGATRTYTPNSGFSGSDSFTFKANDGQADSGIATVNITVQPNPNAPKVEVRYVIRDQWNNGFVADVYIKNNGPAISGWTLAWNFPGNQKISNMWNATYRQTGKSVTATNLSWNKSIPTGGTVTLGFQASYSGANAKPTAFTLNGQPCAIVP